MSGGNKRSYTYKYIELLLPLGMPIFINGFRHGFNGCDRLGGLGGFDRFSGFGGFCE